MLKSESYLTNVWYDLDLQDVHDLQNLRGYRCNLQKCGQIIFNGRFIITYRGKLSGESWRGHGSYDPLPTSIFGTLCFTYIYSYKHI